MGTDEDYLDSLLKAATDSNQNSDMSLDSGNIDSLLMDEQQLAEIDELLGLVDDADDSSKSSTGNDASGSNEVNDDNVSDAAGLEQLLGDLESPDTKEEDVLPDIAPIAAEEEPFFPDAETIGTEEAFSLDDELLSEEGSVTNESDEEEIPADMGADLEQQIENAMMDNSNSGELEIDLNGMEDLDSLLGIKEASSGEPENAENAGNSEDKDLGELLDGLGDDEELAEINELLKKSQNNEFVDEDNDMLALLEETVDKALGDTEEAPVDHAEDIKGVEESPKKKKWGRKKKSSKTDDTQ